MMANAATPLTNHDERRAMAARASALPAEATEPAPAPAPVAQQDPASAQVREPAQAPAQDAAPAPTSCELIAVQTRAVTRTHRHKLFVSI